MTEGPLGESKFFRLLRVMHKSLFSQKLLVCFPVSWIRNTTIYRTYCSTLGFLVESNTLSTFIRNNIIYLIAKWLLCLICVDILSVGQNHISRKVRSICVSPVIRTFIYRCIRTLGFASSAVNTLVCYYNCHGVNLFRLHI